MPDRDPTEDDLSEFASVIELLSDGPSDVEPETPSPELWAGIEHSLAGQAASEGAEVIAIRDRSRWRTTAAWVTLVAAAVLLVAVPVGLSLSSTDDEVVLAMAELAVVGDQSGAPGTADLVEASDDVVLDLETSWTAGGDEFLELWLLEVDADGVVTGLVSLGPIDGSGRYDVPDQLDLARFTIVDISIEADDGDDSHSGNSVLRGGLT